MPNVLAKTNATAFTSLKRAKYHEEQARTLTAKLNSFDKNVKETEIHFDAKLKEFEGKDSTQSGADDVVNKLAESLKVNGPKVHGGGTNR